LPLPDVHERLSGYGIVLDRGETRIITGGELDAELESVGEARNGHGRIVGKTVNLGRYEGQVAVVLTYADLEKVNEGDVVVSPMIDPYFLWAIAKAGAVVTDEGGILNHAAIVSREFNIPGVVGTGIATAALRDGDRVQVDARRDLGIVTKVAEGDQ
jgi:pyruvate,water dikinase